MGFSISFHSCHGYCKLTRRSRICQEQSFRVPPILFYWEGGRGLRTVGGCLYDDKLIKLREIMGWLSYH